MISMYFTDKIKVKTMQYDIWGNLSNIGEKIINCRIEDNNKIIRNKDGKEVSPALLIVTDEEINTLDKINIIERYSKVVTDERDYEIERIDSFGLFSETHFEVYV